MADGIAVDLSELNKLSADIEAAGESVIDPLKTALNRTSMNIKESAQSKVRARPHFAQAAGAINFDVTARQGGVSSEIGYDKDRRKVAKLGNLIEFGAPNSKNALSPGNELQRSLHEEEEDFVRGVRNAVDDALKKNGL